MFCAVFDIKSKKELQKKVLEIIKYYKDAPLLKSNFKNEIEKRGFSRFIVYLMIRETVKALDDKENQLFDKFNYCLKD